MKGKEDKKRREQLKTSEFVISLYILNKQKKLFLYINTNPSQEVFGRIFVTYPKYRFISVNL
jgi:hypothetical protein